MRERAASIAAEVEPELAFAVDAVFPNAPLMASLKALQAQFPMMPVSIFTESLGGSEQRMREGVAHFALIPLATTNAADLSADFLVSIPMLPVVGVDHPLAREAEPIARETLEPHIQLVLTDRTPLTQHIRGGIVSRQIWRFADISTRLEFLLEGFGWCNMPEHMVRKAIDEGRLKALKLAERDPFQFRVHVVHVRGREIGRAARWLIEDLRRRLVYCVETGHIAA
jgi:DNA-binding transcriptional LysR family regulator